MENSTMAKEPRAPKAAAEDVREEVAAVVAPAAPVAPPVARVSLDEACRAISRHSRRTILIAAFHFDEEQAGRLSDTEDAYRARFDAFARRPA
jgi:hypothetical protein